MTDLQVPLAGAEHASAISQPYWDALAEGEFVLQRCAACGSYQHYPRRICRTCASESLEYSAASGTGTIFAATLVHRANASRLAARTPYWLALVQMTEGPLLFALLDGVAGAQVSPDRGSGLQGTAVVVDWAGTRSSGLLTVRPH
jgi:uncharacterized OB-fold protein